MLIAMERHLFLSLKCKKEVGILIHCSVSIPFAGLPDRSDDVGGRSLR